jgi:Na+/melibiose symporter-like transporter
VFVPDAGLWVVIDAVLCGTIWTAMVILIPSMIADLAHNEGLSMRNNRSGTYASIYAWCLSLSGVAVLIISGCTLSLIGFDAALGGQQDTSALLLMRVILSLGTIIFSLLAFILVKRWQADRSQYQFVY